VKTTWNYKQAKSKRKIQQTLERQLRLVQAFICIIHDDMKKKKMIMKLRIYQFTPKWTIIP
jgi:hypothetical protein